MDSISYADLDQDPGFLTKNLEKMRNEGEILVFYNRSILPDPNSIQFLQFHMLIHIRIMNFLTKTF
jgi:hypothetical protein